MAAAALTLPAFSRTEPEGLPCMPTQHGAAEAPQQGCGSSRLQPLIRRAITLGAWGLKTGGSSGLPNHMASAGHQSDRAVLEQQQAAPAEGPLDHQDGSNDSDKESEGDGPGGNAAGISRLRSALDSRPHSLEEAARLFMQRITARRVLQVSDSALWLDAVHAAAEGILLRHARSHSLEGAVRAAHHCTAHGLGGIKVRGLRLSLTNSCC